QTNGPRFQYTANLLPDSSIVMVDLTRQTRAGVTTSILARFTDTLVTARVSAPAGSETVDLPVRGKSTPFLAVSFALAEQIIRSSHVGVGKSAKLTAVRLGIGDTATLTVSRFHADSASITVGDAELRVAL